MADHTAKTVKLKDLKNGDYFMMREEVYQRSAYGCRPNSVEIIRLTKDRQFKQDGYLHSLETSTVSDDIAVIIGTLKQTTVFIPELKTQT